MVNINDLDALLDANVDAILGDTIPYTRAADGSASDIQAHIEYGDEPKNNSGFHDLQRQIFMVEISKSQLPDKPQAGDRFTLPETGAIIFGPINVTTSTSGNHWRFEVKRQSASG